MEGIEERLKELQKLLRMGLITYPRYVEAVKVLRQKKKQIFNLIDFYLDRMNMAQDLYDNNKMNQKCFNALNDFYIQKLKELRAMIYD